jgi:hypothetical protein
MSVAFPFGCWVHSNLMNEKRRLGLCFQELYIFNELIFQLCNRLQSEVWSEVIFYFILFFGGK